MSCVTEGGIVVSVMTLCPGDVQIVLHFALTIEEKNKIYFFKTL